MSRRFMTASTKASRGPSDADWSLGSPLIFMATLMWSCSISNLCVGKTIPDPFRRLAWDEGAGLQQMNQRALDRGSSQLEGLVAGKRQQHQRVETELIK